MNHSFPHKLSDLGPMEVTTLAQDMDEVLRVYDGSIMYPSDLPEFIEAHAVVMRHAWERYGELLFIGCGMNVGDVGFTLNLEWRKP